MCHYKEGKINVADEQTYCEVKLETLIRGHDTYQTCDGTNKLDFGNAYRNI